MQVLNRYRNSLWAIAFFVLLVLGVLFYIDFRKSQWENEVRIQTMEMLMSKKTKLEKSLFSRIYYTRSTAAIVSLNPNISNEDYEHLARVFVGNDTVINSMSLARNCVINAIYPLEGHEAALGLDLLAHPDRKEIVDQTIETRQTFVAGPVELVEGGIAFISYTPIFDITTDTTGKFWGLTDIVILRDALLNEAGLLPEERGFRFVMKGYDGKGNKGEIFWGDPNVFQLHPVSINVELPYGNWVLAAAPLNGWDVFYNYDLILIVMLFFSALAMSVLLYVALRANSKIREDAREFKAIFNSLDTLIFELSVDGEYLKIAPTKISLLVAPPEEIIGKKIRDIFEPELAELFMHSIRQCLETKEVSIIEYPLVLQGEQKWFVARVSYKSPKSVIYNAYDVTAIKEAENELKESEQRLSKLNDIKNRFFSIIAHDLRNPVGSFRNITELLLDDPRKLSSEESMVLIKSMYNTSGSLIDLLENLLSWAQAQQQSIQLQPVSQSVYELCNEVILSQQTNALEKKIEIMNQIDPDHYALFDRSVTNIVIRNLISNALKFSYENTTVKLSSELKKVKGQDFVVLHIADQGCGIPPERINDIFNKETHYKTYGTRNEKGSGLGLMLCKDFVEMQGGEIWVESKVDLGSTFSFTLPVG
ncbi:MAG: CHASE domain-containing protein [Prolixibacteraceae bacterium]|nr:CHASE domain-containing protein [Prolixibacteraceae bacterium]